MGEAYPDLYAAVGVHSGLACGAAERPALRLRRHAQGAPRACRRPMAASRERVVPTIVFHGDQDATVNPRNGDQVIAPGAGRRRRACRRRRRCSAARSPGGRGLQPHAPRRRGGRAVLEQWVVHGAGHAWSGGSPAGSYTDPRGPDASREMLRFFLEHPHPTAA